MLAQWVLITFVFTHGGTCGTMLNRIDPMPSLQACQKEQSRIAKTATGKYTQVCQDIATRPVIIDADRNGNSQGTYGIDNQPPLNSLY